MDFQRFIEQGVTAEHQARHNRAEIYEVIQEFKIGVERYFDSKLTIDRRSFIRNGSMLQTIAKLMAPERYMALVCHALNNPAISQELCEFKESDEGYPVTIKYSGESNTCYDKDSLGSLLAKIASSAHFGRIVLNLLDQVKKAEQKAEAESAAAALIESASIDELREIASHPIDSTNTGNASNDEEIKDDEDRKP